MGFVFLDDGSSRKIIDQTMALLEPMLLDGAYIVIHDWHESNPKSNSVKPYRYIDVYIYLSIEILSL